MPTNKEFVAYKERVLRKAIVEPTEERVRYRRRKSSTGSHYRADGERVLPKATAEQMLMDVR